MTENDIMKVSDEEMVYCKNLFANHDYEEDDWRVFFTIEEDNADGNSVIKYLYDRLNNIIPGRHFIAYADLDDYDRITIEEIKG